MLLFTSPMKASRSPRGPRRNTAPSSTTSTFLASTCKVARLQGAFAPAILRFTQDSVYQLKALHQEFAQPLNIVITAKSKISTGERLHVVLFSSDLSLAYDKLIEYYSLRFQIEFNFRDAKQYWGLEDFMNLQEQPIHNAANLPLFMVNLSKVLLARLEQCRADSSALDLKAHFRAEKYALETLKLLPQKPDAFLIGRILADIPKIGAIRAA